MTTDATCAPEPAPLAPLVLYHGSCNDGFCAAWAVARRYPGAELVACYHGDPPPDVAQRDVWVVDFSFPRAVTRGLAASARSFRLLDHHRSAAAELRGVAHCTFDMDRSGAALAWDTLHPHEPRPWFVEYVQDRDLWRWELPQSRAVNAALATWPHELAAWDALLARSPQELAAQGAAIVEHEERLARRILRHARTLVVAGHPVPAVNSPILPSELGHALALRGREEGAAFSVVYNDLADGSRAYSLRSLAGGADVSEIARRFGGGGHPRAAGFRLPPGVDPAQAPGDDVSR